MLAADTVAVEVTETAMLASLLHALNILAEVGVEKVGVLVVRLAVLVVARTIEESEGEVVLLGVGDDVDDLVDLVGSHLTSPLLHVDLALLQDEVRETATHTLDGGQSVHDLASAIHVSVADTQNVLKIRRLEPDRHLAIVASEYLDHTPYLLLAFFLFFVHHFVFLFAFLPTSASLFIALSIDTNISSFQRPNPPYPFYHSLGISLDGCLS